MYEDPSAFADELVAVTAMDRNSETLTLWHLLEVRYPVLLADYLTRNPDFCPPDERGIRIGKRPEHHQGGRRNLP
jgi:hypothetical protein